MDLSFFATPEAWISLVTLTFLEIVLGVDNIVFITITSDRLPEEKQHIGRKLGLAGAFVTRVIFLCFASFLVSLTTPLFTLPFNGHGFSVRDIVMFVGGAYLIYKGVEELRSILALTEERAEAQHHESERKNLTLPKAVGTIMVMDVVFSIDSVITAVGLAEHLIIMILAVMIAIIVMMVFIDAVSNFINKHAEMKILALTFIAVIGALLVIDALGFHSGIEVIGIPGEKFMIYFAMVFAFVLELIQIRYNNNLRAVREELLNTEIRERVSLENNDTVIED